MKTIVFTITSLLATTASAEITKLGDYGLGQPLKKSVFVKAVSVLGCTGSLRQEIDKGKVVGIELTPDGTCDRKALEAAIEKAYGAKPIASVDRGSRLWEGKTGSTLVITGITGDLRVKVVAPGAGSKRACFADDGFAAFWKTFKAAADKPEAVAATFKFPIKNYDDKVIVKDAKALAKKWPTLVDADDKKELASGALTPTCSVDVGTYTLRLSNSNVSFEAKQVAGTWMWVEINSEAPG